MTAVKKKTKSDAVVAEAPTQIVAYKGFDENLQCRGYQFEVGKTYEHKGRVEICGSGFHACTSPLDVLNYYDITSRFARVTLSGETSSNSEGDTKIAAGRITIEAEIKLPEFIKSAIEAITALCRVKKGDDSVQSTSGHYSQLAASGDSSKLAASGHYSQLAASGHSSKLAASGHSSKLAASGDSSQLAASGHSSKLAASGDSSQLAASGHYSQLAASGDSSVIASSGIGATAKGVDGTWIALPEFVWDGKIGRYLCLGFATGCIGQDGLVADTYYKAVGGKLVRA